MKRVRISPKGQVAIPKAVREALNLTEGKRLRGAAAGTDLIEAFALHKKQEREREDSRF